MIGSYSTQHMQQVVAQSRGPRDVPHMIFTRYVGVAPGTSTVSLGEPPCPPDPAQPAMVSPTAWVPSADPAAPRDTEADIYGSEVELRGLRGSVRKSALLAGLGVAAAVGLAGLAGRALLAR